MGRFDPNRVSLHFHADKSLTRLATRPSATTACVDLILYVLCDVVCDLPPNSDVDTVSVAKLPGADTSVQTVSSTAFWTGSSERRPAPAAQTYCPFGLLRIFFRTTGDLLPCRQCYSLPFQSFHKLTDWVDRMRSPA